MTDITSIFGGSFKRPEPLPDRHHRPPEEQIIDAIAGAGLVPPQHIVMDGKIHRFSSDGKRGGDSGWYVVHSDKICAGAFGCWKQGMTTTWAQDVGRELTAFEQMEHARKVRAARSAADEERQKRRETAQETASDIWGNVSPASDDHPYLQKKGVASHGLRVSGDGRLIVPMMNPDGEIVSLQFISDTGEKRYLGGGAAEGCFHAIHGAGDNAYVAEGYATAATIHELTGATVYVSFSAGQLKAVAKTARGYHEGELVIVADNDTTGRSAAADAAQATKSRVVVPPLDGMDANDYAQAGYDLSALLSPPADDWLIPADAFCEQPAPIRWLIKGWIQRDALIMVHGPSGGGKTFVVLDMCLHMASGKGDWHGSICRPGPVVYLAGEGHHGLRGRIAGWRQHNGVKSLDMWLSKAGTDLNTPEGYTKTRQALLSLPEPPAVIVVDTLHRFLLGDENSAQDAKTMLDACNSLQNEFGAAVVLVHHTGVSEDSQHRARGSSAWRGALDIEISIVPATEEEPIQIIQRKMKDGELSQPIAAMLESVFIEDWWDEDGEQVSTAVITTEHISIAAKADPKVSKYESNFMSAWRDCGSEMVNSCPYLTRAALKDWLIQHVTDSDRTVKNMLDKSRDGSMIKSLLDGQKIRILGSGWIKIQDGFGAADALLNPAPKSPQLAPRGF